MSFLLCFPKFFQFLIPFFLETGNNVVTAVLFPDFPNVFPLYASAVSIDDSTEIQDTEEYSTEIGILKNIVLNLGY